MNIIIYNFDIVPRPAPRMSSSDRYKPRSITQRYFAYRDHLVYLANLKGLHSLPGSIESIVFRIPMPASWSQKKRKELNGTPHQQVPDLDNYLKGFLDALCLDDKHIYSIHKLKKIWSFTGNIQLWLNSVPGSRDPRNIN